MNTEAGYSDLDILYAAYRKLYDFLGTLLDQNVIEVTPAKNAEYRALVNLVEDITQRPENQGIDCFLAFDDLYSDPTLVEEGDVEWQYTISPNMQVSLAHLDELLAQRKITDQVSPSRLSAEIERAAETSEPAFTVSFPNERIIMVNEYVLSKPHFNSRNDQIFSYIYKHPNKRITKDELQKNIKSEQGGGEKKIERVLRDLGFDAVLLHVFFPHLSISAVFFRNPVRLRDLLNGGLDGKAITDFLKLKQK